MSSSSRPGWSARIRRSRQRGAGPGHNGSMEPSSGERPLPVTDRRWFRRRGGSRRARHLRPHWPGPGAHAGAESGPAGPEVAGPDVSGNDRPADHVMTRGMSRRTAPLDPAPSSSRAMSTADTSPLATRGPLHWPNARSLMPAPAVQWVTPHPWTGAGTRCRDRSGPSHGSGSAGGSPLLLAFRTPDGCRRPGDAGDEVGEVGVVRGVRIGLPELLGSLLWGAESGEWPQGAQVVQVAVPGGVRFIRNTWSSGAPRTGRRG